MTLVMVSTIGVCRGQQGLEAARPHVAAAIDGWVDDFANRRLGVRGLLRREVRLQPRYAKHVHRATRALPAAARAMGPLLRKEDYERLTHLDVLQKLLFFAESNPSPAIGDALLRVASVGIAGSFLDRTAFEVRELERLEAPRVDGGRREVEHSRTQRHVRVRLEVLHRRRTRLRAGLRPQEARTVRLADSRTSR